MAASKEFLEFAKSLEESSRILKKLDAPGFQKYPQDFLPSAQTLDVVYYDPVSASRKTCSLHAAFSKPMNLFQTRVIIFVGKSSAGKTELVCVLAIEILNRRISDKNIGRAI